MLMARRRVSDISIVVVVFVVRQAARHKATRTKELRRCTIRGRDDENEDRRREGGIQRRPTFYEGAGGTAGKVQLGYEGRKEGRKVLRRNAAGGARKATQGGWELAFSV